MPALLTCFAVYVPRTPETLQLPEHGLANFVSWRLTAHPILSQGRAVRLVHTPQVSQKKNISLNVTLAIETNTLLFPLRPNGRIELVISLYTLEDEEKWKP